MSGFGKGNVPIATKDTPQKLQNTPGPEPSAFSFTECIMQQIDEIRRMSELARQLRERGLAKDSLDALQQARAVTSSDPAVAQQRKDDAVRDQLELLQRRQETQTRRIEELQSQLADANNRIAQFSAQLSSISAKMRDIESANAAVPRWQVPEPTPVSVPVHAPSRAAASTGPADDISIEKFFYFGKR
jgi:uncharacterized coiled-coil protein SlyX